MLPTKRSRPPLTPATRLPRKPIGSADDVADHVGGLRQDVQQHVLELEDRLDDADDRVDRLVDEALVGGLQLLDARVERVARLDVLLRERVDQRVLLGVDVGRRAGRTAPSSLPSASLPTFCRSCGQLGDVRRRPRPGPRRSAAARRSARRRRCRRPGRSPRPSRSGSRSRPSRVELVDLVGHAEELVLEPAARRRTGRCSGRPCRRPSSRRRSPRTACGRSSSPW